MRKISFMFMLVMLITILTGCSDFDIPEDYTNEQREELVGELMNQKNMGYDIAFRWKSGRYNGIYGYTIYLFDFDRAVVTVKTYHTNKNSKVIEDSIETCQLFKDTDNIWHENTKYSSYEKAEKAMNDKIKSLTKKNSATKYVTVDENSKSVNKNGNKYTFSFKYTTTTVSDTRKWGYVINYTTTTTTDTRENRTLTFHKSTKQERTDYKKLGENDIVFNYSNRSDWTYLYDGRFTSQSTPDEDLWTVTNEYENKTVITGSKTFDMQEQSDIAVPTVAYLNEKLYILLIN